MPLRPCHRGTPSAIATTLGRLSLNTVKRYDRACELEATIQAPTYRPTLVDPFCEHLRQRRAEEPAVPLPRLLAEITALGYTGSADLLMRYIAQGRVEAALTLPYHNGCTEGVNQKIKLLKRLTYGRAGYPLLRQRVLLS